MRSVGGELHFKLLHQDIKEFNWIWGKRVNQLNAIPFKEVNNTSKRMTTSEVYKLICMIYMSMCLSEPVVLSYLSRVELFRFCGSAISIIPYVKECQREEAPKMYIETSGRDWAFWKLLASWAFGTIGTLELVGSLCLVLACKGMVSLPSNFCLLLAFSDRRISISFASLECFYFSTQLLYHFHLINVVITGFLVPSLLFVMFHMVTM